MENLLKPILSLLDSLYFGIISPVFSIMGQGLELLLIRPLQLLQLPAAFQVMFVAVCAAGLSLYIRNVLNVEKKEEAFKKQFTAKKKKQEDLHLISDWKSREKFAKTIDDDIDQDFNAYLAGRFSRYGLTYLLPIFLSLFWLDGVIDQRFIIALPQNSQGYTGLSTQIVFLAAYGITLFISFRIKKRRKRKSEQSAALTAHS